ncbi:unnamed protein product [Adineta steineri]|uniref:G-protein coupled receptors family 1 profile domain-containing protein n=1 Tax=Adineta steineri TaxID=433720 RepID=A0A818Y820_9BILA|nr:unnamed protein product [Adineta steineri]CAF3750164.1 unnamed protein product [Adineta steineri]
MLPSVVGFFNGKNGTETYVWWCKIMNYSADVGYTLSVLALCLASIDRYHATSRNARLRQRSSMKVATISVSIVTLISLLLSMPDLLYWYIDDSFGDPICIYDSIFYYIYSYYFISIFLYLFVSLSLLIIFGVLTYYNLKNVQHASVRNRPNVISVGATAAHTASMITRIPNNNNGNHTIIQQNDTQQAMKTSKQPIDTQFSVMLILEILCYTFANIPSCIQVVYAQATVNYLKSDMTQAIEGLFANLLFVIASTSFCTSFYIYYFSSSTYRQNIKKMLCKKRQIWPAHN